MSLVGKVSIERSMTRSTFTGLYSVRTKGIKLTGHGITMYHSEGGGYNGSAPFNVYAVNDAAMEMIEQKHGPKPLFD